MIARRVYNAFLPAALAAAHASTLFVPKMRAAVAGRRGYRERWLGAGEKIAAARPVWVHVASVGEFEQARPVISALEREHPDVPVVLSFSSPSGYRFATRRETAGRGNIAFIDYLPADTAAAMRFCFDVMRPRLLLLVKFDLWPNLIWTARDRGVTTVLIDATLSPSSHRLSGPGRFLYRSVYRAIDHIVAIGDEDAARFRGTLSDHDSISVAGDTRFDRVMERWQQSTATGFEPPHGNGAVIVAGSTWPRDEAHLLPALGALFAASDQLRLIIAPHEPTPEHVRPLLDWSASHNLPVRTVRDGGPADARVVVIDTVGVLAESYRLGDIAFVGGAFSTGVHSVIEPAIAGLPVVFGPRHDNSLEASRLLERGAAFVARSRDDIENALGRLLDSEADRRAAGAAAADYVRSQLGATAKCMEAIRPRL